MRKKPPVPFSADKNPPVTPGGFNFFLSVSYFYLIFMVLAVVSLFLLYKFKLYFYTVAQSAGFPRNIYGGAMPLRRKPLEGTE